MRGWSLLVALVLVLPLVACTGSPAPTTAKPGAPVKPAAAKPATATPTGAATATSDPAISNTKPEEPPEAYSYQSGGRRDPFLNLLNAGAGADPRATTKRGEGAAGLAVNEIVIRGIVQMNGRLVAMIQGPDGRSYNIHPGDKLADGTVKSVTREGLVIVQDVNDPLSTAKQREVRKLLRSLEEAKQ